MIDFDNDIQILKILKKTKNILCFTFTYNDNVYFGKLFTNLLYNEYFREKNINLYLNKNNNDFTNFAKLLYYYDNIKINNNINKLFHKDIETFHFIVFEYYNSRPLRFYINKLSKKNFNEVLLQIKNSTNILNNLNIIHYDLYCQTNVLLFKNKFNKWIIKIIDFGLSYIDYNDNTNDDYNTLIESIKHFNYKHIISL